MRFPRTSSIFAAFALFLLAFLASGAARANPEAHILRIDPRAGMNGGAPILTTVVEIVEFSSPSEALAPCNNLNGTAALDCWSTTIEKDNVLWKGFDFNLVQKNAFFTVKVNGSDTYAKMEGDPIRWSKAIDQKEPNVGTAWLVAVDASAGMGDKLNDAKQVAYSFIGAMQPGDMMELIVFDSREHQYLGDTKWKSYKERNSVVAELDKATLSRNSGDRSLFSIIKGMISDSFGNLGNYGGVQNIPLHQAMVVLSNGTSKADAASTGPSALVFSDYLNKGRFPDDNSAAPKTPLPLISVWFPNSSSFMGDLYRNNENQFMQQLANIKMGGFFSVVRSGQGQAKGTSIVNAVKKRFNSMYLVKWRLACLNLSVEQTFALNFKNTTPQILGDATFKEVPLGVDPSQWPLDIDVQQTVNEANANPVTPGGLMKVYGNFCWGGDKGRAESYFIPAGTKPDPNASSPDPETAKKAMQSLITQNMRGNATDANEGFVVFQVPDEEKLLEGTGDATVTHVIVYDNGAKRASGHDEKTILTLKAQKKPLPWLLFAGIGGGVVLFGLIIVILLRMSGGNKGRGGGGGRPTPQPVVAGQAPPYGGGYGGPQGYGAPPGGGYGGPPQGGYGGPPYGGGGYPNPKVAPLPVEPAGRGAEVGAQVQCPSCKSTTPYTPGVASFCYSCGSPLPAQTGGVMPYQPGTPAPMSPVRPVVATPPPYGAPAPALGPPRFVLRGASGEHVLDPGRELGVGRDPAKVVILLSEPRVSGLHATIKVDGAGVSVRDEASNNGVWIGGQRIPPGVWTVVPAGSPIRFGPIEFVLEVTRGA
jgi:hypothetical protein